MNVLFVQNYVFPKRKREFYEHHIGFLVETADCYYLFDYYKGTLPRMKRDKPILVFASHAHSDHYNPDIPCITVAFHEVYELPCKTTVETLLSTDEGVAFLLRCPEGTIYHAGDLNDWVWNGEPDEENRQAKELIRSDNRNFTQKRSNISRTKATHKCK